MTLYKLDQIESLDLRPNMKNNNASSIMQYLLANYHKILSQNGLKWKITDNQNVAVQHVLSAIKPASLRHRLQ